MKENFGAIGVPQKQKLFFWRPDQEDCIEWKGRKQYPHIYNLIHSFSVFHNPTPHTNNNLCVLCEECWKRVQGRVGCEWPDGSRDNNSSARRLYQFHYDGRRIIIRVINTSNSHFLNFLFTVGHTLQVAQSAKIKVETGTMDSEINLFLFLFLNQYSYSKTRPYFPGTCMRYIGAVGRGWKPKRRTVDPEKLEELEDDANFVMMGAIKDFNAEASLKPPTLRFIIFLIFPPILSLNHMIEIPPFLKHV